MRRRVTVELTATVADRARLVLALVPARVPGLTIEDELLVRRDGADCSVREVPTRHGGVLHVLDAEPGDYAISYRADADGAETSVEQTVADQLDYLTPSRYAESDELAVLARERFGTLEGAQLVLAVRDFVAGRTLYVPGASRPTDGATQTYLQGEGVCRDFAHLVIALLRAQDVPARLVAVYAPGLDPMDFHAVVEAYVDDTWWVLDATGLAPRQSLLRIATGRDAADTSFLSSYGGAVTLQSIEVSAVVDGPLPLDDHSGLLLLSR
ncbi:transglutaminase family protein [Calidifontibacter sp. DB0510]|uniref:Transglutaminase family protein n=1 Tax=Metallococcus carri TaxID=1656884 RepID=A0A967B0L9_9MICO|nr:transglutaminase family protein [Metallococcus carri]NHN56108.1 transglutaminase family protein [Metallococcus carri]NOP37435.1 transglutaminase family protein [Calidifontibacter sp. DB2511S]